MNRLSHTAGSLLMGLLSVITMGCATTLVANPASAQATCTATALQPLTVTTSRNGSLTQPVGPLPQFFMIQLQGQGEKAQSYASDWGSTLPPGGCGRRVGAELEISFTHQFATMRSCSLSGKVRVHFASPTPVSGVLYLMPDYFLDPFQTYSGDVSVDLDANGVPDYWASTRSGRSVEMAVTLDSVGRDIDVDLNMSASWSVIGPGSVYGKARGYWEVVFIPNTYGLETQRQGCVPLKFGRSPFTSTAWVPGLTASQTSQSSPDIVAAVFLLGLADQNVPLPTPPFCGQFVANPAVVLPTGWNARSMGIFLPDLPLPPGLTFYCQAAWLDTANQIITSDSVRTL